MQSFLHFQSVLLGLCYIGFERSLPLKSQKSSLINKFCLWLLVKALSAEARRSQGIFKEIKNQRQEEEAKASIFESLPSFKGP